MAISLKENYLKSIYLDYADDYYIFIPNAAGKEL